MASVPSITEKIIIAVADAVKTAYSQSFRIVFLASIAFGGMAVVAALLSVSVDERLDSTVAAKLSGAGASEEALNDAEKVNEK